MVVRTRHIIVDIGAVICGGLFVSAINNHSILNGVIALLIAVGIFVFDEKSIEDEENQIKGTKANGASN